MNVLAHDLYSGMAGSKMRIADEYFTLRGSLLLCLRLQQAVKDRRRDQDSCEWIT